MTHRVDGLGVYYMKWAVEGLFNITEVEWQVVNDQLFYPEELELVRSNDDPVVQDDLYLTVFFQHNGDRWQYRVRPTTCNLPDCSGSCFRAIRRYRLPMLHLLLDLHSDHNNHLTNRQKRFFCYRFFTRIRYGTLRRGIRRRICNCVDAEIGFLFPRERGEERVGFRP